MMRSPLADLPTTRRFALSSCLGVVATFVFAAVACADVWTPRAFTTSLGDERFPPGTPVFSLDREQLETLVDHAPLQHTSGRAPTIALPMPDGTWETFECYRAVVMAPELAAKYPGIRTFVGQGRNSRWRLRFELTPGRFRASIWSPKGRVAIEPTVGRDYASVFLSDVLREDAGPQLTCHAESSPDVEQMMGDLLGRMARGGGVANGDSIRSYRTAVAATGEYTAQHGGTVAGGLAGIAETLNRVNEIMGRDFAVALELIPNNDLVVFTDSLTDPYTNGDVLAMRDENVIVMTDSIGAANYDLGHVFGTGEGGLGKIAGVCIGPYKARGVSTAPETHGDEFALIVAHEMGHQLGANHTFNSDSPNCVGPRHESSAYEPGSGTTIMSYAGYCGGQNVADSFSDYYHNHSYSEIVLNMTQGNGRFCVVSTPSGNTPPVAVAETGGFTIPLDTPFVMDGSGTDADGDSLTYCWEQYDLGPAGHPDMPVGNAPLFRSFDPKTVPFRIFPELERVLDNTHVIGEILPFYERDMRFRLTVRDGRGGVHYDEASVAVDGTSGPFRVTSQSTPELWEPNSQQLIKWDVANTDNVIVNCQTVNILLSEDGMSFDRVLAAGTPNDGQETIIVPDDAKISAGRIKVEATDNIFFDLNDADITIPTGVEMSTVVAGLDLEPVRPNPFTGFTRVVCTVPARCRTSLRVYDTAGRLVRVLFDRTVSGGRHFAEWDGVGRDGRSVASGIYFLRLETDRGESKVRKVQLIR